MLNGIKFHFITVKSDWSDFVTHFFNSKTVRNCPLALYDERSLNFRAKTPSRKFRAFCKQSRDVKHSSEKSAKMADPKYATLPGIVRNWLIKSLTIINACFFRRATSRICTKRTIFRKPIKVRILTWVFSNWFFSRILVWFFFFNFRSRNQMQWRRFISLPMKRLADSKVNIWTLLESIFPTKFDEASKKGE